MTKSPVFGALLILLGGRLQLAGLRASVQKNTPKKTRGVRSRYHRAKRAHKINR